MGVAFGEAKASTTLVESLGKQFSDRGSIPLTSTKSTLLELLGSKKFESFEEVSYKVELLTA